MPFGIDDYLLATIISGFGNTLSSFNEDDPVGAGTEADRRFAFNQVDRPLLTGDFAAGMNPVLSDRIRGLGLRKQGQEAISRYQPGTFNPLASFEEGFKPNGGFGVPEPSDFDMEAFIRNLLNSGGPPGPPDDDVADSSVLDDTNIDSAGTHAPEGLAGPGSTPEEDAAVAAEFDRRKQEWQDYNGDPDGFNPGRRRAGPKVIAAANGYQGTVEDPTLFMAGEAGPENVNIQPTGSSAGSGAQTGRGVQPTRRTGRGAPPGRGGHTVVKPIVPPDNVFVPPPFINPNNPPPNPYVPPPDPVVPPADPDGFFNSDLWLEIQKNAMEGLQNVPTIDDFIGNLGEYVTSDVNEMSAARGAFGGSANRNDTAEGLGRLRLDATGRQQQAQRDAFGQALATSGAGFDFAKETFGMNTDDFFKWFMSTQT